LDIFQGFIKFCIHPFQAIWFTDKPGVDGPVFGSNDQWTGLGVFLDSFDNDALVSYINKYIPSIFS